MKNEERSKIAQNELTPKISETIDFFQKSTKWMVVGIIFGLSYSLIYLLFAHSKYEAYALINLSSTSNDVSTINSKLRDSSSYAINILEDCSSNTKFDNFSKNLKITPKGTKPTQLDLRFLSSDPKKSVMCLEGVIDVLRNIEVHEMNKIVKSNEQIINELQEKISAIRLTVNSNSDPQMSAAINYLIARDELNLYRQNILDLKSKNISAKNSVLDGTSLAKISVEQVGPKRKVIFLNGLLSGVVLGLLMQLLVGTKLKFLNRQP